MTLTTVTYEAGTQKSPQQTEITKPCFTDTTGVHFPDGRLSTLPPYASASYTGATISGNVRSIHGQKLTGTQAGTYYLMGTDSGLYVLSNGEMYNLTPFADQDNVPLPVVTGDGVFSFSSGSPTATVEYTAHGLTTSDYVTISGYIEHPGSGITSATLNTQHKVASVATDTFTITMSSNASGTHNHVGGSTTSILIDRPTITLGTNKIETNATTTVTIRHNAHGLTAGQRINIMGVTASIGGVSAATLNAEYTVTTAATDSFTITLAAAASGTASGGTGAGISKQIASGGEDQAAASGYGAGVYQAEGLAYGAGGYSEVSQTYPRIWSFAAFGNSVVMCAGDYTAGDGQKIYLWDGDVTTAPTVILNAPTDCNWVGVVNNAIVALCGDTIKISEIGDLTVWSGLTYYTQQLQRVWKAISLTNLGDKVAIIHTPNEHFLLRYVGGADIWDLADLFLEDGIISPKASTVINSTLFFMGFRGFYAFDGSTVRKIKNEQNESWILENLNNGQNYKCFAMPDTKNQQVYWFFPTGTDTECGDYVIFNPQGHFTLGQMDRSAAQQQMIDSVYLMANGSEIFRHFTTGAVTFNWYAKSSYSYVDGSNLRRYVINRFIPDANQSGTATLNTYGLEYPQGTETTYGTYSITGSTNHLTVRAAGKLTAWKLSGNSQFTMGGYKINVEAQ